jgi:hypothetical protein
MTHRTKFYQFNQVTERLTDFQRQPGGRIEIGLPACRLEQPRPQPPGNPALPWRRFPAWLRERLTVLD